MPSLEELIAQVPDEELRAELAEHAKELSGSTLRQKLEEVTAENKGLKAEKRHSVYKDAGLPDGAYDVFDTLYEGDLTPDAIKAFAAQKGFRVEEAAPSGNESNQSGDNRNLEAGEERLASLGGSAPPANEPSLDDRIAQAESKGEWYEAARLKALKLEALRK
jgi:hypothetical protein